MNKQTYFKSVVTIIQLIILSVILPPVAYAQVVTPEEWVRVLNKPDPMLSNLTIPQDAATKGMWSPVYDWPMNGLHLTILPDGRVLTYGTTLDAGQQEARHLDIWNPTLGFGPESHVTTYRPGQSDVFCSASVFLNDGRLLISGGNGDRVGNDDFTGNQNLIFDAENNTVAQQNATLTLPRWYSTMINLPDGRPIILGGMVPYTEKMIENPDAAVAAGWPSMTPEVYENGQWRSLFGATSRDAFGPEFVRTSYPRAWVAPNGLVFGISAEKMWYLDADAIVTDENNEAVNVGSITTVGDFKQGYSQFNPVNVGALSNSVMYAPGKILHLGGNGGFNSDGLPASDMATVIDINNATTSTALSAQPAPVLTEQPTMFHPRRYANSIVLANGQVVVTGGTKRGNDGGFDIYANIDWAVYPAEIWTEGPNGTAGSWVEAAAAEKIRVYHSQTALMPNGTILSTGGGTPGPVLNKNAEVFYPPYLFKDVNGTAQLADRPLIYAISGLSYAHAAPMQMDMASAAPITDLVLIGLSNGTHSFNPGQRRIPLSFTQEANRLSTVIPNAFLTPPGYYQVVALNADGVPSLGTVISIGQDQVPHIPTVPYSPPDLSGDVSAPIINAGGTATFSVPAEAGLIYSWDFGDGTPATALSTNPTVSHVYTASGLYVATLSVTDTATGVVTQKPFVQAVATAKTVRAPNSSSAMLYETRAGQADRIWVVNPDNDSVSVIEAATNTLISTIPVGESPRNLAIGLQGRVWVTNKTSATISIINQNTLSVDQTINLPRASQPHGIAFKPNWDGVLVVLEAKGQLVQLDHLTGELISSVDVGLHARHVAINAAVDVAMVSRFITPPLPGEGTLTVDASPTNGAEIVIVDPNSMTVLKKTILRHSDKIDTAVQGSGIPNYLAAPVISPDGTTAWIPSKQDNIKRGLQRNGQPLDFQNTVRAITSRIDMTTLTEDYAKRVDHDNASVGAAAVYHPSGIYAFVTLETSRQVAVIDAISGFELFRIEVGHAPQGITISDDGNTLYVQSFMDRSVSVIDLTPLTQNGALQASLSGLVKTVTNEKLAAQVLIGKQLFYDARDARLAKDSYMSCATCHNDGDSDGRVWDFTSLGEGLRNTIALNGRAGTGHGFLHWSANFDEVHDFENQIRTIAGGTGLMTDAQFNTGSVAEKLGDNKAGVSSDLDHLSAYVSSLTTFADNPNRNQDGTLTDAAKAGRALFSQKCLSCHGGGAFTNSIDASTLRDIGTIKVTSGDRSDGPLNGIDVPTLRDVWSSAPYLHDGSAATLGDAVAAHNNVSLGNNDLANIVAYLNQVDGNEESSPALIGAWSFDENTGTTVADTSGNAQTLTLTDVTWSAPKLGAAAGQFNGSSSVASPSPPALISTEKSFTVSAWVKLDGLNGWNTVMNQDGENVSGFWLQYSQQLGGVFNFTMRESDALSSYSYRAKSTTKPVAGEWYHLAAVRDSVTHTMKLYVNGLLESTVTNPYHWSANGQFNIGRGKWGSPNDWFKGAIDEVNVYNYALADADINALYGNGVVAINQPPVVAITAPINHFSITAGDSVTINANATDADGSVKQVAFYDGQTLLFTDTIAPYSYQWTPTVPGAHVITAVATDDLDLAATSSSINVTVVANSGNNSLPTVALSPLSNTAIIEGSNLTLEANAEDSDGTITQVAFYHGQTLLATVTEAPYAFIWENIPAGNYTIFAVATDNVGAVSTSAASSLTVAPLVEQTILADWQFEEGSDLLAADATPNGHDLTLSNTTWVAGKFGDYALQFNGSNAVATPSTPALIDTTESFTISTWVKLDTLNGWRTIANQDGENVSGFWLQYSQQQGSRFVFSMYESDGLSSPDHRVKSTDSPVVGEWYHLVAVRDKAAGTMQLYVNGVLNGTEPLTQTWAANGDFNLGRGKWGQPNDWFNGAIDAVKVYNYAIDAAVVTALYEVGVENQAPSVALTAPVNNVTFTQGVSIGLAADAVDSDGTISSVAFYDGATLISTDETAPYSIDWTNAAPGAHAVTARATDNAGAEAVSAIVNVTIVPVTVGNAVPTSDIVQPANNSVFAQGAPVVLSANAADSDGSIATVSFYSGSNLITTLTESPYIYSWLDASVGDHVITVKATDNAGAVTTSSPINMQVTPVIVPTQIGAWNFDEGQGTVASDISTNANDLNLQNVFWVNGKVGSHALQFNGANAVASLTSAPLIDTANSFTFTAWVKLDTLNGWRTIANQDADNVSGFWLQYSQQLGRHFIFSVYGEDTLSSPAYRATSSTTPVIGQWYHLAGIKDQATGKVKLYVNGQLESEKDYPVQGWTATGQFNIGRGKWGNPNDWFAGAVDEVSVYNYALTDAEVLALYEASNGQ